MEDLKRWEACKYLRLYSDTLLFHFQSSPIPSFHLTGGDEGEEANTAASLLPPSRGPKLCQGTGGRAGGTAAAVALIRGWASRPMSCTVHQRRSASQPESQMTPSTCKALFKPFLLLLSPTSPIIFYCHFSSLLPTAPTHSLPSVIVSCHLSVSPVRPCELHSPVEEIERERHKKDE